MWYNEDCEVSRKECMLLNNSLIHDNTTHIQHQEFHKKLLSYNINGKVLNIIREIYSKAKSCIRKDNMISDYFMCNIGVRQGDNLSPVLFTEFINDFTEYVSTVMEV